MSAGASSICTLGEIIDPILRSSVSTGFRRLGNRKSDRIQIHIPF
jgi:hypothetical protein